MIGISRETLVGPVVQGIAIDGSRARGDMKHAAKAKDLRNRLCFFRRSHAPISLVEGCVIAMSAMREDRMSFE